MKGISYRDRDYSFGEAMLALRTKIGLTQLELAQLLGVSRRAVGDWEAGKSYLKLQHFKKLIVLALEHEAFPAGSEAERIRALWHASHQKVLLDEAWLNALLTSSPKQETNSARDEEPRIRNARQASLVLPFQPTPFVGREAELTEVDALLDDPTCRLLTLVGPGGIGKTRLAMQVAADCAEQFDDGVYFVPLEPLDSPEFIVSTIADVLSFRFSPGVDPGQQLLRYLREKALLLVLDSFEHLLDGAELLAQILQAAHDVKFLVTSREVLNLQEEWRYPIHGLQYPETEESEQPGTYSAVQLFLQRAGQVKGNLVLADDQAAVVRVCQLVEGMPLALELASTWAKTLPTHEIALEIQRNLDFLSTSLRDVPERHQSITAVFAQTWGRLTDEERRVFSALSIFSGGFSREAAEAVVGVSVRMLSYLVDKSLLTREPNGHYQMHELLRQYAETRLETMPEEAIRAHESHSTYYTRFLSDRKSDLNGGRQREACLELEADIANLRVAWSWAVEHSRVEAIDQSQHALLVFYAIQSRHIEGMSAFEKAARMLDNGDPHTEILLARVLCSLGGMCSRGGALEKAREALERSWQLYVQHNVLPIPGQGLDPRVMLAYIYLYQGTNINMVEKLLGEALQDLIMREDRYNLPIAYFLLAMLARLQGKYEEARQYAQQGYTCTVGTGDAFIGSFCLEEWGTASQLLGDTADAKRRLQASYVIREDFRDSRGRADTLASLGRIALREVDNAEARRCYEQARNISHDLGDDVGLVAALEGMGNSARAMRHYGEAQRYFLEALQIASDRMLPRIPSIFVGIGEVFLETGKRAPGLELLALGLHHPAGDQDTKDRAQRLLNRHEPATQEAQPVSTAADFNAIISALLDELLNAEDRTLTSQASQTDETLVEPLSEQELEVLELLADERSDREIAEQLLLSVATVKWYLMHIYSKLGVQNRSLAILRARKLNLLP